MKHFCSVYDNPTCTGIEKQFTIERKRLTVINDQTKPPSLQMKGNPKGFPAQNCTELQI